MIESLIKQAAEKMVCERWSVIWYAWPRRAKDGYRQVYLFMNHENMLRVKYSDGEWKRGTEQFDNESP